MLPVANMRLLPPPDGAHLADAAARGARHQAAQAQAGVQVELEACTGGLRSRSSAVPGGGRLSNARVPTHRGWSSMLAALTVVDARF